MKSKVLLGLVVLSLAPLASWAADSNADQWAADQTDSADTAMLQSRGGGGPADHGGGGGGGFDHGSGGFDHGGAPSRPQPQPFHPAPQPPHQDPVGNRGGGGGFHGTDNRGSNRHYNPVQIHNGVYGGAHWNHPAFNRPAYNFDWDRVRLVTCTAVDYYGNTFPVTESEWAGREYQTEMANIEDAAVDACYNETGGDTSCTLQGCTAGY